MPRRRNDSFELSKEVRYPDGRRVRWRVKATGAGVAVVSNYRVDRFMLASDEPPRPLPPRSWED